MNRSARSGEDGFTILELVVCLGLLALITAWLGEGVALLKRGTAVIERVERQESQRAVGMHVRRAVERAVPFYATGEDQEAVLVFTGESDRLRLVTRSDGRLEGGGLILAEFRAEARDGDRALVTERRPLGSASGVGTEPEAHLLQRGVQTVAFQYFGTPERGTAPVWMSQWTSRTALPLLVRMDLHLLEGSAPAKTSLTVALPAASSRKRGAEGP